MPNQSQSKVTPLYTSQGNLELTPQQHLIFLLGQLQRANEASGRWNARKMEAIRRQEECEEEEAAALESAANLEEWIAEYAKRGVTA